MLAGLFLITLIAESIEFGLVAAINGGIITDQNVYFAIRNRPPVLACKLVYNTVAAIAGGFVCAWVAGRMPMFHASLLAAIQTAGFIYGMAFSEFASTTPQWMWIALTFITIAGILFGARLQANRSHSREKEG